MAVYPEDEEEFGRLWSSASGRCSALQEVQALVAGKAADAFIRKQDELAMMLRALAEEIQLKTKEASKALDGFIAESQNRP